MRRSIIWGPAAFLWLAALDGALQLQQLPAGMFGSHGVCGPWGCGPPVPVLLACHVFWVVLLAPPAVFAAWRLPAQWVWRLGITLIAAGCLGLAGLAAWEGGTWLPQVSAWERQYIIPRYLFALVTLVDVPVAECVLIGAGLCLWTRNGRGECQRRSEPAPRDSFNDGPTAAERNSV